MARKALVLDESVAVQKAVEATLEPRGFEVLALSGSEGAVEEAKRIRPQLMLLDGEMEEGKGYTLCKEIKNDPEIGNIPVILFSSESEEAARKKAQEFGAASVVTKPFREPELVKEVAAVLDLDISDEEMGELEGFDYEEKDTLEEQLESMSDTPVEEEEEILELIDEIEDQPSEPVAAEIGMGEIALEGEKGGMSLLDTDGFTLEDELGELQDSEDISLDEGVDVDLPELGEEELKLTPLIDEEEEEGVETGPQLEEPQPYQESRAALRETISTSELSQEDLDLLTGSDELETLSLEEEIDPLSTYEGQKSMSDTEELDEITLDEELDQEIISEIASGQGAESGKEVPPWMEETQEDLPTDVGAMDEGTLFETSDEEPQQPPELSLEELEEEVKREEAIDAALGDTDILEDLEQEARAIEEMVEEIEAPEEEEAPVEEQQQAVAMEEVEGAKEKEGIAVETMIEEADLEEEIAPLADLEEERGYEVEFQEISLEEIPLLDEGARLEMTEDDFGILSSMPELWMREELTATVNATVERMVMDLAPPIVERVSREIALERAERIIREEIELTRPKGKPS